MAAQQNTPLVTVIIPVFNGAEFIGQTIDSALLQTYRNLEVIIVDDGSTDETPEILRGYVAKDARIRVLTQANGGVSNARNAGIAAARGEFIAPLDADDLWLPGKIARQVRRMQAAGEEAGAVYSWWAWIDEQGSVQDRSPRWTIEGHVLDALLLINFTGNASVPLFRKRCVDEAGGYNATRVGGEHRYCEDWELILKIAARHKIVAVQDVLLGYRRHPGGRSLACDSMWRSHKAMMQDICKLRPDIKPALLRGSDNQFCMYLAGLAYMSGNTKEAIRWGLRSGFRVPLLVGPYIAKMMLFSSRNRKSSLVLRPGESMNTSLIADPLLPYNRIPMALRHIPGWLYWTAARPIRNAVARMIHPVLLARMRSDRRSATSDKPRVLATACWHFPIYSQTFVYREVLALVNKGFDVRFAYAGQTSRKQLPDDLLPLWDLRRRILYADATATDDYEYYRALMAGKVDQIVRTICDASGMTEGEVIEHRHFRHAFSFARFAEAWQPDYIHTYFFYEAAVFGLVASSLLGIPRGVSCYADHMVDDYDLKLVTAHMATCDVVVATSARIKRELEELVEHPLPIAIVKPNGIDSSRFAAVDRPPSIPARVFRGVAVNRIHAKKGMTYLVEAMKLLHDRNVPFVIEILGEYDAHDPQGPAYFEQLKKFVADNQLESSVLFLGRQTAPQVRQHLSSGDIFLAPFVELANGDKDGIPTALLEAMAAGCAIVATDAGSITEVFDNGVEGLMVPQCDSVALADAIALLIADDALRTRLARAAVERVRREFDVSHCEAIFHERVLAAIGAREATATLASAR